MLSSSAIASAGHSRKLPSSGIMTWRPPPAARYTLPPGLFVVLFHRVGHFRRRVFLVVFGQHFARIDHVALAQHALRHHALPFAEQVRQNAGRSRRSRRAS